MDLRDLSSGLKSCTNRWCCV